MGGFDDFFADNYDQVVRSLTLAVGDRARAEDAAQAAYAPPLDEGGDHSPG